MLKKTATVFALLLLTSSCSVFMASKKNGVEADELAQCATRTCLLSKGITPIETKKDKRGNILEENYIVKKPTGSTARAAMHGVLDVATLGIWEVAGTPIEGNMNKEENYTIKVIYLKDGATIKKELILNK